MIFAIVNVFMNIGFTKMHGLGNDFVVIENMSGRISLSKEQVILLCDRHKGVGADGVILIEKSNDSDCFMNYYNSDGTLAQMCGNGVRCVAKFLQDDLKIKKSIFKIDTRAGVKEITSEKDGNFSVNMGKPIFLHEDFPNTPKEIENLKLSFVSMGNPHAVAFVDDLSIYDLEVLGPKIENNSNFPNKINFHLVEKIVRQDLTTKQEFKVRTWERGCGATLACGTGACAVYAVARKHTNAGKSIKIKLPGGELFISENDQGDIIMRGPAVSVFSSMIEV